MGITGLLFLIDDIAAPHGLIQQNSIPAKISQILKINYSFINDENCSKLLEMIILFLDKYMPENKQLKQKLIFLKKIFNIPFNESIIVSIREHLMTPNYNKIYRILNNDHKTFTKNEINVLKIINELLLEGNYYGGRKLKTKIWKKSKGIKNGSTRKKYFR
jgi:hypothetical protein